MGEQDTGHRFPVCTAFMDLKPMSLKWVSDLGGFGKI